MGILQLRGKMGPKTHIRLYCNCCWHGDSANKFQII